jgi:hypothetical protein
MYCKFKDILSISWPRDELAPKYCCLCSWQLRHTTALNSLLWLVHFPSYDVDPSCFPWDIKPHIHFSRCAVRAVMAFISDSTLN